LRLHAFQRDKNSKNTPFKFSWKFLVQDNLIRIITSIATVLENTLGGTVAWSYSNVGVYGASIPISISQAKTICFISSGVANLNIFGAGYQNGTSVQVSNRQLNGTYSDSLMTNVNLEIRVYN
jgi:hypothetical protein